MNTMANIIETKLAFLSPEIFEFRDDSHLHAGHSGNTGGGHYAILIVSNHFSNESRLNRQRIIKNALADLFSDGLIHALSIKALTAEEYFHSS